MTSANITDVSASNNFPVNPYKSDSKKDAKEDFMALMAGSLNNVANQNVNSNANSNAESTVTFNVKGNEGATDTKVSNDSQYKMPVKDRVESIESEDTDFDKVIEKVDKFIDDVKESISEELEVSEDEIVSAMEELGLTFVDLTQPSNLAALLTELKGADDNVSLLLDTSTKEIFDAMGEFTGELFGETGLDTEGLKDVLTLMEPVNSEEVIETPVIGGELETTVSGTPTETNVSAMETEVNADNNANEAPVINTVRANEDNTNPVKTEPQIKEDETSDSGDNDAVNALASKVTRQDTESKGNAQSGMSNNNGQTTANTTTGNVTQTVTEPVVSGDTPTFNQAIADVDVAPEVPQYTSVNTADVIEQIVTQARTSITEQVRSMEIELNPVHLGRMLMQVSENDGQITARFLTQSESVKSALEIAITSLIEKLNDQGIKVDAVEVSVGTHEFEDNLEKNFAQDAREDLNESGQTGEGSRDNRSRGGIHLGDPDYMEGAELTEEEELTASIMRTYGNTVNFTA